MPCLLCHVTPTACAVYNVRISCNGGRHMPYTLYCVYVCVCVCVCVKDGPPAPLTSYAGPPRVAALPAPTNGYAGSPAAERCNPPSPVSHLDCPECSSAAVRAFPRRSQAARCRRALSQAVDSTTGKREHRASPTRQGCTPPVLLHGGHERSWRTAPSCCWRPLESSAVSQLQLGTGIGLAFHKKVHFAVHAALPRAA